jgi:hypothetical protein
MNLRHAAALALVGWYLIAPPVRQPKSEPPYLDDHAEYRAWRILHSFKTRSECESGKERVVRDAENGDLTDLSGGVAGVLDENPKPWLVQQIEAQCIATDDPRLKESK